MKISRKISNIFIKPSLLLLILIIASFTIYQLSQESQDILGTWKSDETPEWKLEFKDNGKCYDYYQNSLDDTYNWSIERTSPQCNQVVPVGDKFSYLKMINVNDPNEKYCYEIFTLSNEHLQIRLLGRSKSMFFTKQ